MIKNFNITIINIENEELEKTNVESINSYLNKIDD